MSIPVLERSLQNVPFLRHLGIRVEETRPGHCVLRLPANPENANAVGGLHTGAMFAVGELTAQVALGTHPALARYVHLQKCTKIKYILSSAKDVTAHATVTDEMVAAIHASVSAGAGQIELPVTVMDGHGKEVAEMMGLFAFRAR